MRACFRRPKYGAAYRNVIYGNPLIVVRAREYMMFLRLLRLPVEFICLFRDCRFTMGELFNLIMEYIMIIPRLPIYHR